VSFQNSHSLTDRLDAASKARSATLARFKARPAADDPAVLARDSARRAVIDAREVRAAEREILRQEALARAEAEATLARQAEAERLEAQRLASEAEAVARQAEMKAQRDARYLARKAKASRGGR
jgi:hypothetical protein